MVIKYKQKKNEEDITKKVIAKVESCIDNGILIYLHDENKDAIGFLSRSGFCPMLGTEKRYRVVSIDTLGDRPQLQTWFKVFRKEDK